MAVSAVPGSGKTLTLALLATKLISEGLVGDDAEVLVVTVQNSAVDNISQRVRRLLVDQGLPPVGCRVCTLHKLASDILRRRYDLAGVEEGFFVVDGAETRRLMHSAADAWIADNRAWWQSFIVDEDGEIRRGPEQRWREETERIGRETAKLCKHLRLSPEEAERLVLGNTPADDFLRIGVGLYTRYARYVQAQSGLDFDDLIWHAVDALDQDATFLDNLREGWPYILEDEAQDSSPLQEEILERIAGKGGNWVRVGDPNQAINSTFTAADPRYFRRFALRDGVASLSLLETGRCSRPIICLANHLVAWACDQHPEDMVQRIAFRRQDLQPTRAHDAQQNPPDEECHIHLRDRPFPDVASQALEVARWAADYSARHPDRTIAVLCPAMWQGAKVVEALLQIPGTIVDDLLRSTPQTRDVAQALAVVVGYLADPTNQSALGSLFAAISEAGLLGERAPAPVQTRRRTLLRSVSPQELLFPRSVANLRELFPPTVSVDEEDLSVLERFAALSGRWVRASSLPVDQLLLTLAQELFLQESDLAICHSIASSLRSVAQMHADWRLPGFLNELKGLASNQRVLLGASLADVRYTAEPGHVAVTTMHKAKGLEWDAVYLVCVDTLEFPDDRAGAFRDELFFMPGRAPATEARKRLEQVVGAEFATPPARSLIDDSRLEYIAERLRLLYVGITRAKRDLALTYCATNGRRRVEAALAFDELRRVSRCAERDETG